LCFGLSALQLVCTHVALLLLAESANAELNHDEMPEILWQSKLLAEWK